MKTPDQGCVTVGTMSADAFWADLANRNQPDEVPEGAICVEDYKRRFGGTTAEASYTLKRMANMGELKQIRLRVKTPVGMRERLYFLPKALTQAVNSSPNKPQRFTKARSK